MDTLRDICRRAGMKATHQRLEILHEILQASDHPSAELIHQRVRRRLPTVSLDTVYRTLAVFDQHGVITRVFSSAGCVRYDPVRERHDHFVCDQCNRILDCRVSGADRLRLPASVRVMGTVERIQVEVRGVCKACLKQGRTRQRP
ncbi:MAG: transcriptional repressor [Candidatus Sumerlaeia bacterium]|nr:transcriptional repressor [Candidatus Sumerlaeia bacterium]